MPEQQKETESIDEEEEEEEMVVTVAGRKVTDYHDVSPKRDSNSYNASGLHDDILSSMCCGPHIVECMKAQIDQINQKQ